MLVIPAIEPSATNLWHLHLFNPCHHPTQIINIFLEIVWWSHMSSASHGGDCSKTYINYIATLMYPICGTTLNFWLNSFLPFVLDDILPEFFLFTNMKTAKLQVQMLALIWVSTQVARLSSEPCYVLRVPQGLKEHQNATKLIRQPSQDYLWVKDCFGVFLLAN